MRSSLIAAAISLTLAAPALGDDDVLCGGDGCARARVPGPATDKDVLAVLNSLPIPIVADLALALAAASLAADHTPGPAPIDEDVLYAYRLCEADYRTTDSYASASTFTEPRYRLEGCKRVLEIYRHEKEARDKQFIDFVTEFYTGDPRPPARPPAPALPELHGLTSPK